MTTIAATSTRALRLFQDTIRGLTRYRALREDPVVIGGCERSGTTLLHRILSAHPSILAIPEETWALCHSKPAGFRESGSPVRKRRLFRHLGRVPHAHYADKRPTRWSEKSPANIYFFKEIEQILQRDVKFIQIVRDGRDVVSSIHRDKMHEPWVSPSRWVASVGVGVGYLENPKILTTKYEDIVTDFDNEIARICDFLGYASVPKQIRQWTLYTPIRHHHSGAIRNLATGSIGKWKRRDAKWKERVAELMSNPEAIELLKRYKYI